MVQKLRRFPYSRKVRSFRIIQEIRTYPFYTVSVDIRAWGCSIKRYVSQFQNAQEIDNRSIGLIVWPTALSSHFKAIQFLSVKSRKQLTFTALNCRFVEKILQSEVSGKNSLSSLAASPPALAEFKSIGRIQKSLSLKKKCVNSANEFGQGG